MTKTITDYHTPAQSSATSVWRIAFLCVDGRTDEAAALLGGGCDPHSVLTRGIVEYWQASSGNGLHEQAKDTLTRATELLWDRNDQLLAQVFLGLCYSRQGQPREAAILINQAATDTTDDLTRYVALLSSAVLDLEQKAWQSALDTLGLTAPMVDEIPNATLRGKFFHQRGLAYKLGGDFDAAINNYDSALVHFEEAGNDECQARTLNNLANLYICIDTNRAHINIDPAISIFRRIGSQLELAQAYDTKAQIYLQEADYRRALGSANQAIEFLSNDQQLWLPDFLSTRGRAFAGLKQIPEALADFTQAAERAELMGDKEAAGRSYLAAIASLASQLSLGELIDLFRQVHRLTPDKKTESAMKILGRVVFASSLPELEKTGRAQEGEIIRKALEQAHGSIRKAALLMDIPRNTLAFKIKHHSELVPYLKQPRRTVIKK